jgi:hypothetical protein
MNEMKILVAMGPDETVKIIQSRILDKAFLEINLLGE